MAILGQGSPTLLAPVLLGDQEDVQVGSSPFHIWRSRSGSTVSPPSGYKSLASLMRFRPLTIGKIQIVDPRPEIMVRQLFAAPMALVGAAGIIYFALPETGNPGFLVVLGTFLFSFSAGLIGFELRDGF